MLGDCDCVLYVGYDVFSGAGVLGFGSFELLVVGFVCVSV